MRKAAGLVLIVIAMLALTACGISRTGAANDANAACKAHGGVATGAQNQFYYHDDGENSSWNATCADGWVVAGA